MKRKDLPVSTTGNIKDKPKKRRIRKRFVRVAPTDGPITKDSVLNFSIVQSNLISKEDNNFEKLHQEYRIISITSIWRWKKTIKDDFPHASEQEMQMRLKEKYLAFVEDERAKQEKKIMQSQTPEEKINLLTLQNQILQAFATQKIALCNQYLQKIQQLEGEIQALKSQQAANPSIDLPPSLSIGQLPALTDVDRFSLFYHSSAEQPPALDYESPQP